MFLGARNFVAGGGPFTIHNSDHGRSGIDILLKASNPYAAADVEPRQYVPSCFPGIREQYIDDIIDWAVTGDHDQMPSIYWMRGPAGVGKSAIAQTCAKDLKDAGYLGAAFFFSIHDCDDPRRFFISLAYQLSTVLPDYRQVLDSAIQNDKTLITKDMSGQFNGLIVGPLRELSRQGKEVRRRAIFIDGLDECSSADAQSKIVEIVAASVQDKTTPFRWAIFSKAEAHIVSCFARVDVSPHTRFALLPVSRECDGEIETYLRGGFENMLRRRNLSLLSSWPTDEAIKRLVVASAGLFAYPATVLRFVDRSSYWGFRVRLEAVLKTILRPNSQSPHSPFAELDAFYILIMKQIPEDILPSALLLLGSMIEVGTFSRRWSVAVFCNTLGLSRIEFRSILNALQAVLTFEDTPEFPTVVDQGIDPVCSCLDQDQPIHKHSPICQRLYGVHGIIDFYHKSFYDFLIDPARSLVFCVTTPACRKKRFEHRVRRHLHYARSLVIKDNKLVLAPRISSFSDSLSWPQGNEFVDSFLLLVAFTSNSSLLYYHTHSFVQFLKDVPHRSLLQDLADLDYRKPLVCDISLHGHGRFLTTTVVGRPVGKCRCIPGTVYMRVTPKDFNTLDLITFLGMVQRLEDLGVIKPYHPLLPLTFASVYQSFSRQLTSSGLRYGQYKLGDGEKSVIWYWEIDTELECFHEFRTVNFWQAKRIFETEKFDMWEDDWQMLS